MAIALIIAVLVPALRAPLHYGRTSAALANTAFADICVVGQFGPILNAAGGVIADQVVADLVNNGGDTATSGFEADQFCVDIQPAGWNVLHAEPIRIAGLTILCGSAPTLTVIGQGIRAARDEAKTEVGEWIAAVYAAFRIPISDLVETAVREETAGAGANPSASSGNETPTATTVAPTAGIDGQ